MTIERTEGILLHTLDFRDHDLILTLLTRNFGLIKLIYKGGKSFKRKQGAVTAPLTLAECVYRKGKGDLHSLQEISVIDAGLRLRSSLESLETACGMLRIINATQLPGKPSPALFQTLKIFLKNLPDFPFKPTLAAAFSLKLLKHEGLFFFDHLCSICGKTPEALYYKRESFCPLHAPKDALALSREERAAIVRMAQCRALAEIASLEITPELSAKVDRMVADAISLA